MMTIIKTKYVLGYVCDLCGHILDCDFEPPTEHIGEDIPEEIPCPECGFGTMKSEELPIHTYEED